MTEIEYLFGLVLLLLGFNLGYYESDKGLTIKDVRHFFGWVTGKFRKQGWQ